MTIQQILIMDLTIQQVLNLQGAALGATLSSLLQDMPQLLRLTCIGCALLVDGVRAFRLTLQMNRSLRELSLQNCVLENGGICLIADALLGNSTMDSLICLSCRYRSSTRVDTTQKDCLVGEPRPFQG
jgi:hypothetical protein